MSDSVRHQLNRKLLLVGAAPGLAYGLVLRFAFQTTFLNRFGRFDGLGLPTRCSIRDGRFL
jgi:hypothetical protein